MTGVVYTDSMLFNLCWFKEDINFKWNSFSYWVWSRKCVL